jgi:catalase
MEGFGVHTFRFVNAKDESTLRQVPLEAEARSAIGAVDEAVKIAGADPDFHRRDLWRLSSPATSPNGSCGVQLFRQRVC